MNEETIIKIKDLKKSFDNGSIMALNGVNIEIKKGEFVSIIGPSGSGKSTLLNMLGALDKPDDGVIKVSGFDLGKGDLSHFRSEEIGFIFQLHNLIPNLTVRENVELPMYEKKMTSKKIKDKAIRLLKQVELSDKMYRKPTELSGGERQRVAIARALANDPSIILADEPTGSLDSKTGKMILEGLRKIHNQEDVTLIIVTHDMTVANMADRIIQVLDGKIKT
jgi:putative ABC transport system ATP-binding protein